MLYSKVVFLFFFSLFYLECSSKENIGGVGLYVENKKLTWTINVGILEDNRAPKIDKEKLRLSLEESIQNLENFLPKIQISFLLDQGLDFSFMFQRLYISPKSRKKQKYILSWINWQENLPILRKFSFSLEEIQKEKKFWLAFSDKNNGNRLDSHWRLYLANQVRYDLVFGNTPIYSDAIEARKEVKLRDNRTVDWSLVEMPARSSLENYGAYIHLGNLSSSTRNYKSYEKHISLATLAMILPSGINYGKLKVKKSYWEKRFKYLYLLGSFHRGKRDICLKVRKAKKVHSYPNFLKLSQNQKDALRKSYMKISQYCQKKWW